MKIETCTADQNDTTRTIRAVGAHILIERRYLPHMGTDLLKRVGDFARRHSTKQPASFRPVLSVSTKPVSQDVFVDCLSRNTPP